MYISLEKEDMVACIYLITALLGGRRLCICQSHRLLQLTNILERHQVMEVIAQRTHFDEGTSHLFHAFEIAFGKTKF